MKTLLVTGSDGFIGRNLVQALRRLTDVAIRCFDITDKAEALYAGLDEADIVFHLAGVNRPQKEVEFLTGNAHLTAQIVEHLLKGRRKPMVVLASSIQADLDNPYGRSKRKAEDSVEMYGKEGGGAVIFRLPNVFGKWSRPNYNSAVATFCYNIARGLDITVTDANRVVELVYIDDVVKSFVALLHDSGQAGTRRLAVDPVTKITLGELASELYRMRAVRTDLQLPDMNDRFRRCLFATYLSFLPTDSFDYQLTRHVDNRGALAEILKSPHFGQLFVSRTKAGVTRGNHFHNTKFEKFCVVEGEAMICFRAIAGTHVLSYKIRGDEFRVVDIPPGYTHSIENVGLSDLIVLFWSSEVFDPTSPDTYSLPVLEK